eukprot:scaffold11381_cov68-Phaeocystis_antarctica.AAC.9
MGHAVRVLPCELSHTRHDRGDRHILHAPAGVALVKHKLHAPAHSIERGGDARGGGAAGACLGERRAGWREVDMHVGSRIRPVDGVLTNDGADGVAGWDAVGGPQLQRGCVAVDAQHWYAARGDRTGAPATGATETVHQAHRALKHAYPFTQAFTNTGAHPHATTPPRRALRASRVACSATTSLTSTLRVPREADGSSGPTAPPNALPAMRRPRSAAAISPTA